MVDVTAHDLAEAQATTAPRKGETPAEFADRVTLIARARIGASIVRRLRSWGLGVIAVNDKTLRTMRARGVPLIDLTPDEKDHT